MERRREKYREREREEIQDRITWRKKTLCFDLNYGKTKTDYGEMEREVQRERERGNTRQNNFETENSNPDPN